MPSKFGKSQHRNLELSLLAYLYDMIGVLSYPKRVLNILLKTYLNYKLFHNFLTTFKKRE